MKHRWGIIATGNIAKKMAEAIAVLENAEVVAVCSRTIENANGFAKQFNIKKTYDDLNAFLQDDEIDHVYIATPHVMHQNEVVACLNLGKNVLCEKPMGINQAQVEVMSNSALAGGCFLMEAMWTQFFPAIRKMHQLIAHGEIGNVKQIKADFCFHLPISPEHRLLNPNLAGGALLDVGIYTLYFAQCIKNEAPVEIHGTAHLGKTGVDEQSSYLLKYADGCIAQLTSAVQTESPQTAHVIGETGRIEVPMFWNPDSINLHKEGKQHTFDFERLGNGYTYEVIEFQKCIEERKMESDVLPLEQSVEIARQMDAIRKQWGLRYPME